MVANAKILNFPRKDSPRACMECPIRERAICRNCDAEELHDLDAIKTYRTFEAGSHIVLAGDRVPFLGSVVSGVATLTQGMADGRRQMVGLLLPSDFVGRPGVEIAAFDVVAATDLVLCSFQRQPFERLMREIPHISEQILKHTFDELEAARHWMTVLGRKTAREKISSLLLIFARRQVVLDVSKADQTRFVLPLTREAMADFLGLTIETVSRQISALRRDGMIELCDRKTIEVPSIQNLIDASGDCAFDR